jgi:protein subunit release factor A
LIYEYRGIVKTFEWQTIREIIIDRLEGSRRSISGHKIEASVRTSFVAAVQHYYSIYNNYGKFKKIEFADKQIKIGRHTVDISAKLIPRNINDVENILIPVKTRETEGGGHSHLFTRDIMSPINDMKNEMKNPHLVVVIIAEN